MKPVLNMPHGSIMKLSDKIQNQTVHRLATRLNSILIADINYTLFYAIIMVTEHNITKKVNIADYLDM